MLQVPWPSRPPPDPPARKTGPAASGLNDDAHGQGVRAGGDGHIKQHPSGGDRSHGSLPGGATRVEDGEEVGDDDDEGFIPDDETIR